MAGQRQQKVVSEVGHFYYDWALSRYRWTDDRFPNKADGLPFKEVLPALCEVKEFVKKDSGSSIHVEIKNKRKESVEDGLKPLQDIDVNQIPCGRHYSQDNLNANAISKQGPTLNKKHVSNLLLTSHDEQELAKGHGTMIKVLQTRLLRLRAAQTLWHKDTNALIEYLLRLKDDAVLVDVMPFLTSRVREVSSEAYALSMGACLEMLPALERLLTSKFEDYVISGLNMIREMIKRWWLQLKVATNKGGDPELYRCSRSVSGLYMAIVSLSSVIVKLTKRRGRVGEKAVVVTRLLDLL